MSENLIPLTDTLAIKASLQGSLIYLAMAVYVLALFFYLCRLPKYAMRVYFCGFIIALASVVWRWCHVGHIPLQNMFEVFLVLGAAGWPISRFCRRFLQVGGEPGDVLLSFVFLFPAGLVFSEAPAHLPPALQSPLFGPHVMAYMLAYFIMAKAALQVILQLMTKNGDSHLFSDNQKPGNYKFVPKTGDCPRFLYRLVCLGFPLLTLGLVLGSVWGKLAWGDYWNWDPKELWSLASWLVYLIYFHWRFAFGAKYPKTGSVLVLLGFAFIIITLLWVNLSRIFGGLHSYASP